MDIFNDTSEKRRRCYTGWVSMKFQQVSGRSRTWTSRATATCITLSSRCSYCLRRHHPTFAAGSVPGYTLIDLVEEVRCMDVTVNAALAMLCQVSPPIDLSPVERGGKFGEIAWRMVKKYELDACFTKSRPWRESRKESFERCAAAAEEIKAPGGQALMV